MSPEKRGIGRQNLSGAFAKRSEGLDILPPMSAPESETSAAASTTAEPAADAETAPKTKARTPRKPAPRKTKPASKPSPPVSATAAGAAANRAFHVDIALRDLLRDHINKHPGTNYTTTVFDAIEQNLEALKETQEPAPSGSGSLFERAPRGHRTDRVNRVQVTLRLTQRNEDILDHLVEETGAMNRSDLVSRALRAFFN